MDEGGLALTFKAFLSILLKCVILLVLEHFLSYNDSDFLRFLPITFSPLILGSQQDGEYNHHFINDETREQREKGGRNHYL